jgi:hypothetical protein
MQTEESEGTPSRPKPRRGIVRRALKLAGAAGQAADAALSLGAAEAELSRSAMPHLALWFCLSLLFGISVVACLWTAAVLGLTTLTGSLPVALGTMGALSVLLLAIAIVVLRRVLQWASFPESRRRLVALLQSLGYGRDGNAGHRAS